MAKLFRKKAVAVLLTISLLAAIMAVGTASVGAFDGHSGLGYYPGIYISSSDGQFIPDLESIYPVWAEYVKKEWGDDDTSKEAFLRSLEDSCYWDDDSNWLFGLTLEQAADKIAKERSKDFQHCARYAEELEELDFLVYMLNITDIGELIDGKLCVTIESYRQDEIPWTEPVKPITVTKNEIEIPAATYSEGELWTDFLLNRYDWDEDTSQEEIERMINSHTQDDGPMTVTRTYNLSVSVGINEFIVDDGSSDYFPLIKLIVNVAESQSPSNLSSIDISTSSKEQDQSSSDVSGEKSTIRSPQTGDNSAPIVWLSVMFVAMGMILVVKFARHRKITNKG